MTLSAVCLLQAPGQFVTLLNLVVQLGTYEEGGGEISLSATQPSHIHALFSHLIRMIQG